MSNLKKEDYDSGLSLQDLLIVMEGITIMMLSFFWGNKDYFRYCYKFDESEVIYGTVYKPGPSSVKKYIDFHVRIGVEYNGKEYTPLFARNCFEQTWDVVPIHVIERPSRDTPIFVRPLIFPTYDMIGVGFIIGFIVYKLTKKWKLFSKKK